MELGYHKLCVWQNGSKRYDRTISNLNGLNTGPQFLKHICLFRACDRF